MKKLEFDNLHKINCALIDSSSLQLVTEPLLMHLLSSRVHDVLDDRLLDYARVEKKQILEALDVIARFIAYDMVCVDELAWENRANRSSYGDLPAVLNDALATTLVDKTAYIVAAKNVLTFGEATSLRPRDAAQDHPLRTKKLFWDPSDKEFHDHLARESRVAELAYPSWVNHSDKSPARVLFYLELARMARIPVFLSPDKRQFFPYFREKIVPEYLKMVEVTADKHLFEQISKLLRDAYYCAPTFELPPLAEFIVNTAKHQGISIFESVQQVRNSKNACEFRKWAGEVQALLLSGDRGSYTEAAQKIKKLIEYASQWREATDAGAGTRYVLRKISLQKIPPIGWLMELFGLGQMTIKDPILGGIPGYISFVAEWFENPRNGST